MPLNPFDWLYGTDKSLDEGKALDARRESVVIPQYQPGGVSYEKIKATRGETIADIVAEQEPGIFEQSRANALDQKGNAIWDANNQSDSGIFALLKRLLVIGTAFVVGWLLYKFEGFSPIKRFAQSNKYGYWIVGGVVALILFISWRYLKGTADSAKNVSQNFGKNLKTIF